MRATFCGTAQAFPDAARAGASVLLESEGSALLLDCGPGAPVRAYETRPGLARLEAVLVSHLHFDHALGLAELLTRLAFDDRTPPPIYGPRGTADYTASALDFARTQHRFLAGGKWLSLLDDVRVHECDGGEATKLGPFTAQAATTEHAADLHSLAWRVDSGSASVVYSGDTSERSEPIARLARSAGTLIHECYSKTALERHLAGEPKQRAAAIRNAFEETHTRVEAAAALARGAGVERLILTHLLPTEEPAALFAAARAEFEGELLAAEDGVSIEL